MRGLFPGRRPISVIDAATGFILAPWVAPLFFAIAIGVMNGWQTALRELLVIAWIHGLVGYAAALTLGLLAYARRPPTEGPLYYVLGGAACGAVFGALFTFEHGLAEFLAAGAGASSGLVFWAVVVWRSRPKVAPT